jgi:hypothetical protein
MVGEMSRRLVTAERSGRWGTVLAVAGLMLALFLVSLDQTVVGTALLKIVAKLNVFDRYAWVTTAYLLASTATIAIIGKPCAPASQSLQSMAWAVVSGPGYQLPRPLPRRAPRSGEPAPSRNPKSYQFPLLASL